MKIYFKHPGGWEFRFCRRPLEKDKFYALCYLAAGALAVILMSVFINAVAGR